MSEKDLNITVISPEKIIYSGQVDYIKVPGSDGYFGIMVNHAPLVAVVDIGVLELKNSGNTIRIVVEGGFIEVKANKVSVLTNGGDVKDKIDLEKAKKDLENLINDVSIKNRDLQIKKAQARILAYEL
ncbi:MAG: ATP synthase F1 subunit epsilon [Leptospiraceae bacterium]|nr:ATP synthase F1 subunit epsilon [Leptospiraceae bacterium]MCP5494607.1 ATP synthase F1 subunit epsilon [Leptospiraceae bacterium]